MKLIINFISKLGVDSVSRLIGFLTLPIITRALGPEGYGLYSYLFVILSYFGFFVDFGYLSYGTNKLCEKVDSKLIIGKIISLQILTLIFTYTVLFIAGYFIFDSEKYLMLLIFSFTFITQTFAIRYYYLANNKLYYNSISELAGQLIYAGLIFLVFINYSSVTLLIVFSVIQSAVTALFLFIPYIRKNHIRINLNLKYNLKTLKEAYKLGLANKAEGITSSFIILSAGIILNEQAVGYYNASNKIYLILLTVVQGLSYTLMPVLLKSVKKNDARNVNKLSLIFYLYLFTGIILSILTYIFSDTIISVMFGEKFSESAMILKMFSITILLWPMVMFSGLVILAFNRYNYILIISVTSMILSLIFSLTFINLFGITGTGMVLPFVAAGTIIISYFYLSKISKDENFGINEIFYPDNFVKGIKEMLGKSS
ncbi:MAG TPA: oligosaccharide flippase family protein [Ignavibacteria bacterium]|nr:oligosaccharide flippase family protein [Ignavibacteria bacterium]HMR39849.1 oligosaccharide flippase family protein [Ignavibacteria bacterium]